MQTLSMKATVWTALKNYSGHFLASVSLVAGFGLVGNASIAQAESVTTNTQQSQTAKTAIAANAATLPNGIYLYGESAKPDEIGKGYFVFEVNQGQVVGALYMPRSSFDCASGRFQGEQLALTVVNSYDRQPNPFEIAVERTSTVATTGNPALQSIGLQGFQRLDQVSENDVRMLQTCKSDFQK